MVKPLMPSAAAVAHLVVRAGAKLWQQELAARSSQSCRCLFQRAKNNFGQLPKHAQRVSETPAVGSSPGRALPLLPRLAEQLPARVPQVCGKSWRALVAELAAESYAKLAVHVVERQ
jgi:hypothetical protein